MELKLPVRDRRRGGRHCSVCESWDGSRCARGYAPKGMWGKSHHDNAVLTKRTLRNPLYAFARDCLDFKRKKRGRPPLRSRTKAYRREYYLRNRSKFKMYYLKRRKRILAASAARKE